MSPLTLASPSHSTGSTLQDPAGIGSENPLSSIGEITLTIQKKSNADFLDEQNKLKEKTKLVFQELLNRQAATNGVLLELNKQVEELKARLEIQKKLNQEELTSLKAKNEAEIKSNQSSMLEFTNKKKFYRTLFELIERVNRPCSSLPDHERDRSKYVYQNANPYLQELLRYLFPNINR